MIFLSPTSLATILLRSPHSPYTIALLAFFFSVLETSQVLSASQALYLWCSLCLDQFLTILLSLSPHSLHTHLVNSSSSFRSLINSAERLLLTF